MAQNLVVPRVYRPVTFEVCMQEVIGSTAKDIAGIEPNFDSEGVGTGDAVILGTGEMVWFHKKFGRFLDRYDIEDVCADLSSELPPSFGSSFTDVSVGDFKIRMEKDRAGAQSNFLVATVGSWQCMSERRYALNAIGKLAGKPAVGLNRDKSCGPKVKLAEMPYGIVPEDFEKSLNERVGELMISISAGAIEPIIVENVKQPA